MPKANRKCHCCGREYYYCPSCPDDRRDPQIYVMWDSELCREIFDVLTNESVKKITTLECKEKLIKLGVTKNTVLKDSVRRHVDRVMSYKEKTREEVASVLEEINALKEHNTTEINNSIEVADVESVETNDVVSIDNIVKHVKKTKRTKRSSLKNKGNSEVD